MPISNKSTSKIAPLNTSLRITNHTQTSIWRGRAAVSYNNEALGDITGVSLKKDSTIALFLEKILNTFFKKTYIGLDFEGIRVYVEKSTIQKKLTILQKQKELRDLHFSTISKLLKETTPFDLPKTENLLEEDITLVDETYNRLLKTAQESHEQLTTEKLSIANRKITLMAIRKEGGEVNIYAKPSSKNINYQILGKGSFKTVVKAVNLTQNSLVAIAKPNKKLEDNNRAVSDAEKEYGIIKKLEESGVSHTMKAHDFVVIKRNHKDKYILVTDLAPKGSLATNITRAKDEPSLRTKWASQICQAVLDMHEKGKMLHLDIKPDNILIDVQDNILLTDYGFSSNITDTSTNPRGSPLYLAPEIIAGRRTFDWNQNTKYDAWAVGLTLYELKYGSIQDDVPMPSDFILVDKSKEEIQRLIQENLSNHIYKNLDKKDTYDNVVRSLLEPDPDERITLNEAYTQLQTIPQENRKG